MIATVLVLTVAIIVGAVQVVLDIFLFSAMFAFKAGKGILSLFIKLALYGLGFWLLFGLFKAFVKVSVIGFAIGFFPLLFLYCIKKLKNP